MVESMIKILGKPTYVSVFVAMTVGLLGQPSLAEHHTHQHLFTLTNKPLRQPFKKQVDYGPLIRAMRQFLANDRYLLESQLTLAAKTPGANLESTVQIQTISEEPNKFRTKISFMNKKRAVGKEYLLVSDSKQVWTHNVADNIYSVVDYSQFQNDNDNFLSGMLSRLFSTIRNTAGQDNISLLVTVPEAQLIEILEAKLTQDIAGLTTQTQRLEGEKYMTYSYLDAKKGYKMSAFIDTLTSEIKYFQIVSNSKQKFDVEVTEKVIQYTTPPSVPADAFQFVPPTGAQLQKTPISINPFLQ